MKRFFAIAAGASLLVSSAAMNGVMAGPADHGPLAPGKPAGIRKAQDNDDNTMIYIIGAGIVAAGIAIAASGDSDGDLAAGSVSTSTSTSKTTATTST
jgi:hypothetical protein